MNAQPNAAIEAARAQGRQTWPYEPLYQLLHTTLPAFHMTSGILDVPALATTLNCTAESIYKWFRAGKLPPVRVGAIHELMLRDDNVALLNDVGQAPPTLKQLLDLSSASAN